MIVRLVAALLFLACLASGPAWAAVAVDATSNDTSDASTATSLTKSHTTGAGSNRYALACSRSIATSSTESPANTPTYNGVAMTKLAEVMQTGSAAVRAELWGLLAPASGAHSWAVTWNTAAYVAFGFITFTGVDQTTPTDTPQAAHSQEAAGEGSSLALVSQAGAFIVDCVGVQFAFGSVTPGAGQTAQISQLGAASLDFLGMSTRSGATTATNTWDWAASNRPWVATGVSLNASGAAYAPTTRTLADCAQATFDTANAAAHNGDTIAFPSSACAVNWSALSTISYKNYTVLGYYAGTYDATYGNPDACSGTVITDTSGSASDPAVLRWTPNGNDTNTWGVRNVCFKDGTSTSTVGTDKGMVALSGTSSTMVFQKNYFRSVRFPGVNFAGYLRGVFSKNTHEMAGANGYAVAGFHETWGNIPGDTSGNGSWYAANSMGTAEAIFFENSKFLNTYGLAEVPASDGWKGIRWVFRYSYFLNSLVGNHGNDSNSTRSAYQAEYYNNVCVADATLPGMSECIATRGGSTLVANNTVTVTAGSLARIFNQATFRNTDRFEAAETAWGPCNRPTSTSLTNSGTTATAYLGSHAFEAGDLIIVAGATPSAYNGTFTVVSATNGTVSAITRSGTTATVTTSAAHGLSNNDQVTIFGADQSAYDITATVTVTDTTHFTYTVAGSPTTPATGLSIRWWGPRLTYTMLSNPGGSATVQGTVGNAWDHNTDAEGYICMDQPGAGSDGVLITGTFPTATPPGWPSQASSPAYIWNNTKGGLAFNTSAGNPTVLINRDWFEGTAKPGWTAYTYPHPLVAAAGVVDPTLSTVVAASSSVTANGTSTTTVTVTLKDGTSLPVASKTVSLGQATGHSTITPSSGASDANGQVVFTVKNATVESVTYTATDTTDSITITQTATVSFIAIATTCGITSGLNPSVQGQSVLFTATVTPVETPFGVATGTVTFKDGTTSLGSATLPSSPTFPTSALGVGAHSMTVVYAGDSHYATCTSSPLTQTVGSAPSGTGTTIKGAIGIKGGVRIQ